MEARVEGQAQAESSGSVLPWLIALAWFAASLTAVLWIWGLDPLVFPMPDESLVRHAAQLIGEGHAPFLNVPIADPEDLFHPRSWITIGDKAWPSYAPVSFYAYGYLLRLGNAGLVLIAALPASAIAAFAAAVSNLVPRPRKWLGFLAPLVAFPALYWLLRPWINMSPMLVGFAWSTFCWSRWRTTERAGWLVASTLCLGFGASVRPDCAAYAFTTMLLLCLAAAPAQWRRILIAVCASGVLAVGANLLLNKAITGHASRAAYQMAVERQWGPEPEHDIPGLGMLLSLLVPMGLPKPGVFLICFKKYWLGMGPIAVVTVGQLGLFAFMRGRSRKAQLLTLGAVLSGLMFAVSRMHFGLFGEDIDIGEYHHSVPRYLSPLYLVAALPPLLFVGHARQRWLAIVGSLVLVVVAGCASWEVWAGQSGSLSTIRTYVRDKELALPQMARELPRDAIVYSYAEDKWLWSRYRLATAASPEPTADSMKRARDARLKVFYVQPRVTPALRRLSVALERHNLTLFRLDSRRGIYAVE